MAGLYEYGFDYSAAFREGLDAAKQRGTQADMLLYICKWIDEHPSMTSDEILTIIGDAVAEVTGGFSYPVITKDSNVPFYVVADNQNFPPSNISEIMDMGYRFATQVASDRHAILRYANGIPTAVELRAHAPANIIVTYPESTWSSISQENRIELWNAGVRLVVVQVGELDGHIEHLHADGNSHLVDVVKSVNGATGDVKISTDGGGTVISVNGVSAENVILDNLMTSTGGKLLYSGQSDGFTLSSVGVGQSGVLTLAGNTLSVNSAALFGVNNPPPYPVTSVSGKTGNVTLNKTDVGLFNVDNFTTSTNSNVDQNSADTFMTPATTAYAISTKSPVRSINGYTGDVYLSNGNKELLYRNPTPHTPTQGFLLNVTPGRYRQYLMSFTSAVGYTHDLTDKVIPSNLDGGHQIMAFANVPTGWEVALRRVEIGPSQIRVSGGTFCPVTAKPSFVSNNGALAPFEIWGVTW